jgi:hypothetical protein
LVFQATVPIVVSTAEMLAEFRDTLTSVNGDDPAEVASAIMRLTYSDKARAAAIESQGRLWDALNFENVGAAWVRNLTVALSGGG